MYIQVCLLIPFYHCYNLISLPDENLESNYFHIQYDFEVSIPPEKISEIGIKGTIGMDKSR